MRKIIILSLISSSLIAQDKGNFESYSNKFYNSIVKESKDYFFDSLYCETHKDTNNDKYYPTFITDIGAEYDNKNIKNLKINSCSYYK